MKLSRILAFALAFVVMGAAASTRAQTVNLQEGFAPLVEKVSPAVVSILTNPRGAGSGVIVSADGTIVTNHHVIARARTIDVQLSDKRVFRAKVVGTDPKTDIAVLKIDAKDLPSLAFGDSTRIRIGEFALTIGNPFGFGGSVSLGIVSAVGRRDLGVNDFEDFIQTDAAINPGNSGGPLINARGEVIGINSVMFAGQSGANQRIGFAISANLARAVVSQIQKRGKVVRGFLGVLFEDGSKGVFVNEVQPRTPAAKAGLRAGDLIVALEGQAVSDSRSLRLQIASFEPGTKIRLGVLRNGKRQEVQATLAPRPEE